MAENTNISWSDHTWTPWYGCTQVSMGEHGACVGCYARHLSETRMGRVVFGGPGRGEGTRDAKADSGWKEPLKWEKEEAAKRAVFQGIARPPCFIFPSMCDPFDNHPDLPPLRRRFFDLIRATPHLMWLLLTKRPGNVVKLYAEAQADPEFPGVCAMWPRNAAIGCTVVTQEEADRDIPKLLAAKAALNPAFAFVSMEPLLGPVDLTRLQRPHREGYGAGYIDALRGWTRGAGHGYREFDADTKLDWIITGGETDQGSHRARPSHPDWFRSLRDQCAAAGVAYHHKQNGEWAPDYPEGFSGATAMLDVPRGDWDGCVWRVGKKAAGRLLDGVSHDARPEGRS